MAAPAPSFVYFHVPSDRALLAALGEMALRHEHLSHILRMTIKTLANLRPQEALDATAYDGSGQLRARVRKLARQRLGEGEPLLKLQAILERCKRATDQRNDFMHSVWAQELDGEPMRRGNDQKMYPLPTVLQLEELSREIDDLTQILNTARLSGFLADALKNRAPGSE